MLRVESWAIGALVSLLAACSPDGEDLCEKGCAYAKKCDLWTPQGNCVAYCVGHFDDSSDRCQEKFEDAVNCFGQDEMCRWDGFVCSEEYHAADDACGWVDGSREP